MWSIYVRKRGLTDEQRDFIADLASEEARSVTESYSFILHEIFESRHHCSVIIEGSKRALDNLLAVFRDNFNGTTTYKALR